MRPDRLARLHQAVDRQAAEAVVVVPFAGDGYLVGARDDARPIVEIEAVVKAVPKTTRAMGSGSATGHNAELRTATHTARFTASAVPYGLDHNDRVVLLERAGEDGTLLELQVDSAMPFGTDRTTLMLKGL